MLGEGRQIFSQHRVYISYTYFLHIYVNFSANESFAHVFIDNHTKIKSYFSDFRGKHRKHDAELFLTIADIYIYIYVCVCVCVCVRVSVCVCVCI